ncbi:MAG: ATP-dependent Clp protease proteolytic subunit [bacterium]|nr:ATP-dependent Clp protease proteolytic subunit [bacterium]
MVKLKKQKREIYLCGEITKYSAKLVKKALRELDKISDETILFYITGDGGRAEPALEIHHALHNAKSTVNTVAHGHVYSAALLILEGGDRKFATPNCKFGFHQTFAEFKKDSELNAIQLTNIAHKILLQDATQIYILTSGGRDTNKIVELFSSNATIDSKKALKLKIIDGLWRKPIHKPRR